MKRRHARIIGTGSALPDRVVTNDQLARDLASRGVEHAPVHEHRAAR